MYPFSILLILLVGGTLLGVVIPQVFRDAGKASGRPKIMLSLGGILLTIGLIGFFGSAFSSVGGLNWLGATFEWPVGFASGVITTKDGLHVVPHTPSGRVQVYAADWTFQRGWHVDAGGGTFKLVPKDVDSFEVITARGQHRYAFDVQGNLLTDGNYSPSSYSDFDGSSDAHFVPTPIWLWVFSHPFISWAVGGVGVALLIVHDRRWKKRKARKLSTHQTG